MSVSIDCHNARRGIFLQNTTDSRLESCRISDVRIDGGDGIRLHFGCKRITVAHCQISCSADVPYGTYRKGLHGIRVVGETTSPTASLVETGQLSRPVVSTLNNRILNNLVVGGTHGIEVFGASGVHIEENQCRGQSHRNIICSPTASHVHIEKNELHECGSSGIHCALGTTDVVIRRNKVLSSSVLSHNDGAAIQMYIGCARILVEENDIQGNFTYGMHGSFSTEDCRWVRNKVKLAGGLGLAALSVESDWTTSVSTTRRFTRLRYYKGLPQAVLPTRSFQLIENDVAGGRCGVSLTQINKSALREVHIHRNVLRINPSITSPIVLACIEDTPFSLSDISFGQNQASVSDGIGAYLFTRGQDHFAHFSAASRVAGN